MNYDSFCMAAAVDELRSTCLGAFVDQVYQPDPLQVVLAFTGRGPRRFWLLSCDARWPRAHQTRHRKPSPATPPNFCMLLRKHLDGARLADVEQVRFDRILRLTFRRGEETRVLIHEVMGRHSNLMLIGEGGHVVGAVKVVPPSQTRVRPVLPGQLYQEPPGARPDPRELSEAELRELLAGVKTPEEITRRLSGWGTFPAREAFALAETEGSLPAAVNALMDRVRHARFEPCVFMDEQARPRGVWAFRSVQPGYERVRAFPTVSEACDDFYGYQELHAETETARKTLLGAVERTLKTARLQLDEANAALEGLEQAEELKIKGELLSANTQSVEAGAAFVDLPNWYDPEQKPLRIALDVELDARGNADRYFRRYRRAMAAAEAALERIPALTEEVRELDTFVARTRIAEEAELPELQAEAKRRGWLRAQAEGPGKQQKPIAEFPAGVRIKRIPVGKWEVLYGENATSNDYLTTKIAKPGDLWLHARAITGSHVVIPGVGAIDRLPPEVLREAARIAAAHSEAKHSAFVSVDYTFRRYVRKPRGSAPGFVVYTHEKTLNVEPK